MQQTFSWKLNLCYDNKHIVKVVLRQIIPDYTNFPDKKIQIFQADKIA